MSRARVHPREHEPLVRKPVEAVLAKMLRSLFPEEGGIVVAVGGPGGTGKSTFARSLAVRLGDASVLRLDDYKSPRSARMKAGLFGPHPAANKMDLIAEHLASLKERHPFDKPVYDPTAGDAQTTEPHALARFNIVEGEVATYRQFRDLIDFSVFIDSHWRTQLATRLGRDMDERGYSLEKAIATFLHSNLREFARYGAESKRWADLRLFCRHDYRLEFQSVSHSMRERLLASLRGDQEEAHWRALLAQGET